MEELKIIAEFNDLKADLTKWGAFVDDIIKEKVNDYNFGDIQIGPKFRLKGDDSFIHKALHRQKGYENPLLNIEDKIGTRIIVLTTDVVDKLSKDLLSCNCWDIKCAKSKQDLYEDSPDRFGYQSIHYIVSPKADCGLFALDRLPLLTCEIQIRTLLQHAYAEVSHDNVYKGPYNNDASILRDLAKSMALMETADDFFCKISEKISHPDNPEAKLLSFLTTKYEEIIAGSSAPVDMNLSQNVLSLLKKKVVRESQIEEFLINRKDIVDSIKSCKSSLCRQPIIILLAYLIENERYFLEETWDEDPQIIKSLKFSLGISTGKY